MKTFKTAVAGVVLFAAFALFVPGAFAAVTGTVSRWVGNLLVFDGTTGNNAFTFDVDGLRGDFGTGADDYLSSNGTYVQTANLGRVLSANPDAGAPWGVTFTFDGYNAQPGATLNTINGNRLHPRTRPLRLSWVSQVLGVGAGNATVIVRDNTAGTNLCTNAVACAAVVGALDTVECTPPTAAAATLSDVLLQIDCTTCTTCPLGNVSAELQPLPGD